MKIAADRPGRILDWGCGYGQMTSLLAGRGLDVSAFDYQDDLEADGLIRKRSAKPAVVMARNPSVNLSWNFKNFADMAVFTKNAQLAVKSYRKEKSPLLQRHFGMGKNEAGYCLRSVLSVGEQRKAQITTPIMG